MVISDHLCVCTFEGKENLVMSNAMYFSEAYNASILSTGVSPQTGSFQATIKLAEINSGIQCPASFTLNLMVGVSAFSRRSPTSTSYPAQNSSLNIPAIIGTLGQPMRMYCASGAIAGSGAHARRGGRAEIWCGPAGGGLRVGFLFGEGVVALGVLEVVGWRLQVQLTEGR